MDRWVADVAIVCAVAALFDPFGSSEALLTQATLFSVRPSVGTTMIVMVALAPAARSPTVQFTSEGGEQVGARAAATAARVRIDRALTS